MRGCRDRKPESGPKRDVRGQTHWAFWNQREDRAWNNPSGKIDDAPTNGFAADTAARFYQLSFHCGFTRGEVRRRIFEAGEHRRAITSVAVLFQLQFRVRSFHSSPRMGGRR